MFPSHINIASFTIEAILELLNFGKQERKYFMGGGRTEDLSIEMLTMVYIES